jgi:hypothetical protein
MPHVITLTTLAAEAGMSRQAIHQNVAAGKIKTVPLPGSATRVGVTTSEAERFLSAREKTSFQPSRRPGKRMTFIAR